MHHMLVVNLLGSTCNLPGDAFLLPSSRLLVRGLHHLQGISPAFLFHF